MNRIKLAASAINYSNIKTVLDVGCRSGILKKYLPSKLEYFGNDLISGANVHYVGDIMDIDFDRRFDCVFALDILEHVDMLHDLFDKLVSLSNESLIVSLPNTYDLKSRYKFVIKGHLGGKYKFSGLNSLDRHRWLMSYDEIYHFFQVKASQYDMDVVILY